MQSVMVINRHDPDSSVPYSHTVAVTKNSGSALQWIQDEVDGKHGTGHQYARGIPVQEWIDWGYFSINPYAVQE